MSAEYLVNLVMRLLTSDRGIVGELGRKLGRTLSPP